MNNTTSIQKLVLIVCKETSSTVKVLMGYDHVKETLNISTDTLAAVGLPLDDWSPEMFLVIESDTLNLYEFNHYVRDDQGSEIAVVFSAKHHKINNTINDYLSTKNKIA